METYVTRIHSLLKEMILKHFCLSSVQWGFFSLVTIRLMLRKENKAIITVHDKDCLLQQLLFNQNVTFVYTQQE